MNSTTVPMSQATKMKLKGVEPRRSQFQTSYSQVLELLHREIWHLGAFEYVLEIDMDERYFKLDGNPRANAVSNSPAVAISFKAHPGGPMEFICGNFLDWRDNVYGIARGLEALRMIDRYGITQAADQYAGFKALGSGIAMPPIAPQMTQDEAVAILREASMWAGYLSITDEVALRSAYHRAVKIHHPDVGGDAARFTEIRKAYELLVAS